MSSVIALIPARSGSKGIPGKNFRQLGGYCLWQHAAFCAQAARCDLVVMSSDADGDGRAASAGHPVDLWATNVRRLYRPAELAQDDTPMLAVVQHALAQIPGQPDDIIVLLQPTQVFRKPEHVQQAIALLRESGADSVVSVVPLPLTHNSAFHLAIADTGELWPDRVRGYFESKAAEWKRFAGLTCRQHAHQTYIRDGTVYAFWRKTVEQHGTIYGQDVRPLIIDPADSCELDTEQQWADLERRWATRHG